MYRSWSSSEQVEQKYFQTNKNNNAQELEQREQVKQKHFQTNKNDNAQELEQP